jgi:phosphate-selective porin OprO/OprP
VSSIELLDGEFAFQAGPVHGSAEYLMSRLDADALNDPNFAGYNFAAGWFLTGEHLAYNHFDGVFGAPRVGKELGEEGCGAFELVARYSNLNLNGGTVRAHEIANTIVGVNWYLSNSVRFAIDGVHSHVQTQGSVNLLELWFQVSF